MKENNNSQFNHFKLHTQYSICEGAIKIDDLKDHCKKNKIQAVGISDTSNLCGALEFSENIAKVGSQPLIGTQIIFNYKNTFGLIPIIAKNEKGYQNIIELSSKSYLLNNDLNLPNCNFEDLLNLQNDIIVLSGSINGLIGKLFFNGLNFEIENIYKSLKKNFRNNFYIEIQRHGDQNEKSFESFNLMLSKKLEVPIIATNEVYYLNKDMHDAHEALMCIGNKTYLNDPKRKKLSNNHYLKSSEEMKELFKDIPEALENNYYLPQRCSYRPKSSQPILPNISKSNTDDADQILQNQSIEGLKKKINNQISDYKSKKDISIYKDRLNHELKIITEMKYSSYFLIVSDYIKWAKSNNIPVGPGRGSGAGSLVAWCLSITDVDPIKFNLIFERFLNPDRISMPDFDIDFCEEKRDLVFRYLKDKYKDSVAHIITFGKLKARMVIRDVGRVIGLSYGFVDSISKMIPFDPSRPQNLTECINSEPRLQKLIKEDKRVKRLIDLSLKLEGLNRNFATHAAGVVIADKKLTNSIPLYKDNSSDLLLPSTQFDMYSAENAGLIKFDFLGLKTLTVIDKTQKLIKEKEKNFRVDKINYDDQKVFNLLSEGNTVGIFQLESSGMREAIMKMMPNHLEDIIALVALYRPGPMNNIPTYNDCKHGKIKPDYLHPKLEEILKPTYGVIIYQEQVMQIAQKLSGFTAAQADILRKAMGKKKRAELEKQKEKFILGAVKNGISKDVAAGIYLKIEPFAEYGFNKSHAASYAIIAYQTAYLKTYFPHEFFSASMTMDISNQNKLSEFYEELKRLNIRIQRPDINKCYADFRSDKDIFYYALGAIKSVGYEAVSNIVNERLENGKFKSMSDFINRVNPKDINKLQLEGLIKAGAFDSIYSNRHSLLSSVPNLIIKSKNIHENKNTNQIDLFDDQNSDKDLFTKTEDWQFEERLSKEFESVGFFISNHPINKFKEFFEVYKIINYSNFISDNNINVCNIASTILKVQEKKTSKGNSYAIVKLTDLSSVFELFIFSDLLEINREIIKEGNSVMLSLKKNIIEDANRFKRINILKIALMKNLLSEPIKNIEFSINNISQLKKIEEILEEKGNSNVKILFQDLDQKLVFNLKNKRKINRKSLSNLKNDNILTNIY